jgi:hypothetical protein
MEDNEGIQKKQTKKSKKIQKMKHTKKMKINTRRKEGQQGL